MRTSSCRFVLSKIIEDEVASEYGYDIFEPTVGLEVAGKNIFSDLGLDGSDRVVIMHFLEVALGKTIRLLDDISRDPGGEYEFWLLGNEYGIELQRRGDVLEEYLRSSTTRPFELIWRNSAPVQLIFLFVAGIGPEDPSIEPVWVAEILNSTTASLSLARSFRIS